MLYDKSVDFTYDTREAAARTRTFSPSSVCVHEKHNISYKSPTNGSCRMIVLPAYVPKKGKTRHSTSKILTKYIDHDLINEVLMFCIFKSDHLEFLNTLPREVNVDLSLLFRSKNTLRYPRVL